MYKLVTNDSSAYALAILPFEGIVEKRGMQKKVLCLAFGTEIDTLAKVKEICNDELKMAAITVYENSVQVRAESDYTVLEQITTATVTNEDGVEVDVLMAKMSKATSIPEQITSLENSVKTLGEENATLFKANEELKSANKTLVNKVSSLEEANTEFKSANETLANKVSSLEEMNAELKESMTVVNDLQEATSSNSSEINAIKEKIADVDEDSLDLDALKEYRIHASKVNLATYLETHTVTSDCHGGVETEYSMTQDKQTQLMAVIMMCTLNPEYQPSWNASGEVCTYDWTVDELQVLAATIEATVRPLVSKQQTMEVAIRNAMSIENVKAVDITF